MTDYNPNADTIRKQIAEIAETGEGNFLRNFYGKTLDGSDVAEYLTSIGFNVASFRDTGRYGSVMLDNGVEVSTNGYARLK